MLSVLLFILKIIGYILLFILSFILLVILIILFTPLKYEIYCKINNSPETLAGRVRFGYFFNILNGQIVYKDGRPRYYVAVFKKKFICSRKPKEDIKEDKEKEYKEDISFKGNEEKYMKRSVPAEDSIKEDNFKYADEKMDAEKVIENDHHDILPEKEETDHNKEKKFTKKRRVLKHRFSRLKEKIKNMYIKICDKIKVIREKKQVIDEFFNNKIHRKAILKAFKEIKILLRKLKPCNLSGRIKYGFEDPSVTGKVLAVLSMVLPYIGDGLKIEPQFDNELIYEGNIGFEGRIKISYFVTLCIKLAVCKSVWKTFMDGKAIIGDMK